MKKQDLTLILFLKSIIFKELSLIFNVCSISNEKKLTAISS